MNRDLIRQDGSGPSFDFLTKVVLVQLLRNMHDGKGHWDDWKPDKYELMEGVLRNVQNIATSLKYSDPQNYPAVQKSVADTVIYLMKILDNSQ